METARNGNFVTRAELAAHLNPLREDVTEIREDVKALLASQAASRALTIWNRFLVGTVGLGCLGFVATLAWLASGH